MSRTEKLLETAQKIWEENLYKDGLPDPVDVCGYETTSNPWYKYNYQKLRQILHERSQSGFAQGVFHTLTAISMDERKKENISFQEGSGI